VASMTAEERACGGDLESFRMKSETSQSGLLFIGSKLSATVCKREVLLIVLELISSGSSLKPVLMKILSASVQD
jgi:hypothetical protein